jgi:16S rRNA (cytosine967-C5)-methyltransferase
MTARRSVRKGPLRAPTKPRLPERPRRERPPLPAPPRDPDDTRVVAPVVDALAFLLAQVLRFDGPADAVMSRYFKQQPQLGPRDRSLVAEGTFFALRRLATLRWRLQPARPERAPRLAALVVLGLQHGFEALEARALRGDERAVRNALAMDLTHAPAAVRGEVPPWLHQRVAAQYPDADALLAAMTEAAPLDLRVNRLKATPADVLAELNAATRLHAPLQAEPMRYSLEGVRLWQKPALTRWPLYQDGWIEVQDEGSQLIARLVAPRRGEMVVDFCAGAGGKTLAMGALMRSSGRLYAFDINARRLAGLTPRLARAGLSNVHPVAIAHENDARVKRLAGKIDRVLVDAPCSGSGTLRRNPDLKWRFDERELARVNDVQGEVLQAAARLVKPGGRLVYATCSLLATENQQVVEQFCAAHPQFRVIPAAEVLAQQGIVIDQMERFAPWFVMLPHLHQTDGFFAAVLERQA